jgi:hypothetical protein
MVEVHYVIWRTPFLILIAIAQAKDSPQSAGPRIEPRTYLAAARHANSSRHTLTTDATRNYCAELSELAN